MTPNEKYSKYSATDCRNLINSIRAINPEITVGDLVAFLEFRVVEADKQTEEKGLQLVKEVEGKCFRIHFSNTRTVWMKIHEVVPFVAFGEVDARLIGERKVKCNGEIKVFTMNAESDERYSGFFPSDKKQISEASYDLLRDYFNSINA